MFKNGIILMLCLAIICPVKAASSSTKKRMERARKAAEVTDYPAVPWDNSFVFQSKYYEVKTNTSKMVASYIGQLMDYANKNYQKIFGYDGKIPPLNIYAYRTHEEYQKIGDCPEWSSGYFRHGGGNSSIHVAYIDKWGKYRPTEVLLHEGTHQFVHLAFSFLIPENCKKSFRFEKISTVPLWLNEGMARYMETAYYNGKKLVVGEINDFAIRDLQNNLKKDNLNSLKELFKMKSYEEFKFEQYNMAYGVVYWFLTDSRRSKQNEKRTILKNYLKACTNAFFTEGSGETFKSRFTNESGVINDFWNEWQSYKEQAAFDTFKEMTVGKDGSFEKWEEIWKRWILALKPGKPYGGLRK